MSGKGSAELPDFIKQKVYPLFLQLLPQSLEALADAIKDRQWQDARQIAHKMAGTLGALGAQSVAGDLLLELRSAIREERPVAQIEQLHEQFSHAARQALQQVAAYLNRK